MLHPKPEKLHPKPHTMCPFKGVEEDFGIRAETFTVFEEGFSRASGASGFEAGIWLLGSPCRGTESFAGARLTRQKGFWKDMKACSKRATTHILESRSDGQIWTCRGRPKFHSHERTDDPSVLATWMPSW